MSALKTIEGDRPATVAAERSGSSPLPARTPIVFGFAWADGALVVCKTGVRLKPSFPLIWEMAHWAFYLPVLAAVALVARLRRRCAPIRIWYAPDRPGPWYLLRGAALWAGYGVAATAHEADAAFYFDDSTEGSISSPAGRRLLNGGCTDISKSHVAKMFADVFGYPLHVEPALACGPIVEKAEKNGVHDGRIVEAPLQPRPGYAYQRLIDTTGSDGLVHDLRTPCVGGAPVVVWEKTKPVGNRFTIHNSRAVLLDPASVYSSVELGLIATFNARMGLDWGGLDILRDRADGRIYIVDVNKTDLGPVIALGWGDKLRSMHRLSRALSALVASAMKARDADGIEAADLLPLLGGEPRPIVGDGDASAPAFAAGEAGFDRGDGTSVGKRVLDEVGEELRQQLSIAVDGHVRLDGTGERLARVFRRRPVGLDHALENLREVDTPEAGAADAAFALTDPK